jgi:hypothetical protein
LDYGIQNIWSGFRNSVGSWGVGVLGSWGVGVLGNVGKSRKVENKYDDGEKK